MGAFTLTTLAALAALLTASAPASAQAPDTWVKFAPEREGLVALMPAQPAARDVRVEGGALNLSGRSYVATGEDGATYTVLSLDDANNAGARLVAANKDYVSARFDGEGAYLDEIAEVAWEVFVRQEYERYRKDKIGDQPGMDYRREFEVSGRPAREYLIALQKAHGPVYLCIDGPRVYVVAALGPAIQWPQLTRFVESFSPRPALPARTDGPASVGEGVGVGPGRGAGTGAGEIDYNRPFNQRAVTQKAAILSKPDPGFTEEARRFNVTGVVRLRAILSRTGEVTNIAVVKGLPHGLTARAVNAARGIKFRPAQKDGRAVSQYIVFEYNFNIY